MIVGIAGHIGAGKDSVADRLVRAHGFSKIGFADAIIADLRERYPSLLYAYAEEHYSESLIARLGLDAIMNLMLRDQRTGVTRALLQDHGTAMRRLVVNYWVQRLSKLVDQLSLAGPVAITGVRYPDEIAMIRERDGLVVKVHRPDHATAHDGHEVEHGLDGWTDWDAVLVNDGTLLDLETRVDRWIASALWAA